MITILRDGIKLNYKQFLFPGGEIGVKLDTENYKFHFDGAKIFVIARIQSSNDLMELALVKDALKRFDSKATIELLLPYVPYGRQDRVCVKGESFSLLVFAKMLKAIDFEKVTIFDPHSEVTPSTFEAAGINVTVVSQFDIIHQFEAFTKRVLEGVLFVSPDAGANKKTSELAKYYNHAEFIRADKKRNLHTGEIKETIVYAEDLHGMDVVIADDICDGGRTFIELAKALKAKNSGRIILYVTHGIFSKGVEALLHHGIDEIFITNSWGGVNQLGMGKNVTTLELEKIFIK